MMLSALLVLLFSSPGQVLTEMINASSGALTLSIELCAIYAVWLGMLEIVDKSGLSGKLSSLLKPIIKKLFKTKDDETEKAIALNMASNMLGLGNAATPMGIKAIQKLDDGTGVATPAIIMLIVINATSIQLLPTTVMGLRSSAGSLSPGDIIIPTLISTTITTLLGIFLVSVFNRFRRSR